MTTIPADLFVNATPGVLAAGGSALDLNGLVLTTSSRVPIGTVASFSSVSAVEDYFGSGSTEAIIAGGGAGFGSGYFGGFDSSTVKPAAILFTQYPTASVAAYLRGGELGLTLTQLQALSATLSVTIDGVLKTSAVNLAGATSFTNAAQLIATDLAIHGVQDGDFLATIAANVMTVSLVNSGEIQVGDLIVGAGVTAASYVASLGTGTGGVGTYNLTQSSTVGSSTAMVADLPGCYYDSVTGAFVIQSGTAGASSTITFGSGSMATSLKLTQATGAVTSQGAVAAAPAAFMDAVINQTRNWATFMTAFDPDNGSGFANKLLFSGWANGKKNRFAYMAADTDVSPTASKPATGSYGYAVAQANYSGTCLLWQSTDTNLAAMACGFVASVNFQALNGRVSFAYKAQTGMVPSVTTEAAAVNLGGNPQVVGDRGNGYNYYGAIATANANFVDFQRGFISGPFLWLDTFTNQIWLTANLQAALLLLMAQQNSIPFNAAGDGLIEASVADVIEQAIDFGAIAKGVALSSSQIAAVNAAAGGRDVASILSTQGWYLLIAAATPAVRQARGPRAVTFFYVDGESVQSISLSSIVLQ
jgi:hypothetical protein